MQLTPSLAKGTTRQFQIRSCSLKTDDLKRLYKLLKKRAQEDASQAIGMLRQLPEQTEEQFNQLKQTATSLLRLVVIVNTSSGDWTSSSSDEALSDASLPDPKGGFPALHKTK
jgi:DNA polymerase III gamma/tau subunit